MSRRILVPLAFMFCALIAPSLTGCGFGSGEGAATVIQATGQNATPAPARVSFSVQLSEHAAANYEPRLTMRKGSKTGSARVRFRLTGLNVNNPSATTPTTTTDTTVDVPAGSRVATISLDAPAGPTIANVAILGDGDVEGMRDFAGATTLQAGANTMTVNPCNSRMPQDRLANTLQQIAVATDAVRNAPSDIVAQTTTVINSINRNEEAADQKGVVNTLSRIRPPNMTELKQGAEGGAANLALSAGSLRVTATNFWSGGQLSEPTVGQMAFKQILLPALDGSGFVACEHRYFPDCFAVARVNAQAQRAAYVRNRGKCYATFMMPDHSFVVGGNSRAVLKPVLFRWNGQTDAHTVGTLSGESSHAGLMWYRQFDDAVATPQDPDAGVTGVRFDGQSTNVLLVSVKDATTQTTKVYRIDGNTGLDATDANVTAGGNIGVIPRRGVIEGVVTSMAAGTALADVLVDVRDAAGQSVAVKYSDSAGAYSFSVPVSTYSLRFTKTGFADSTYANVVVKANQTTNLNTVQMVPTTDTRPSDINGTVRFYNHNTQVIETLAGAALRVYAGPEPSGTPVRTGTSGTDGSYSFIDIAPGVYTLEAVMNGGYNAYLTLTVNPNLILNNRDIYMQEQVLQDGVVNTTELRFVLSWSHVDDAVRNTSDGSTNLDLDAHLMGPMHPAFFSVYPNAPARFNMYWRYAHSTTTSADNCQQDFGMPITDLNRYIEQDIDSMVAGRPEFITLRDMVDDAVYVTNGYSATGKTIYYDFYVRDYYRSPDFSGYRDNTNGIRTNNPDTVLGMSDAKLIIYQGTRQLQVFRVPYGGVGCDWNVCRLYLYRANPTDQYGTPVIEAVNTFDTFAALNYVSTSASVRTGSPHKNAAVPTGKSIAPGFGPLRDGPVDLIKNTTPVAAVR